jgi:hypothetical protein
MAIQSAAASIRYGSTSDWADTDSSDGAAAPVLAAGEIGVDTDKGEMFIGDGSSAATALARFKRVKTTLVTLAAGTKTTADTSITANTVIIPVHKTLGTVTAAKIITVTRSAGVSFTLTSTDNTDTSVIAVTIYEP